MSKRVAWIGLLGFVGSVVAACSSDSNNGSGGTGGQGPCACGVGGSQGTGGSSGAGGTMGNTGGSTGTTGGSTGTTNTGGSGGAEAQPDASTGGTGSGGVDAGSGGSGGNEPSSGGSGGQGTDVEDAGIDAASAGPAVTAVGTPIDGVPVATATIGAAGGTLASGDGQVLLTIPAGALVSNTTIAIQAIENLVPGATGYAYRFTPDGQTFVHPVTLAFKPSYGQLDGSSLDHVRLAFQGANHEWNVVPVTANGGTNTVTGTTTHFTDYGYLLDLQLTGNNALFTKQASFLRVTSVPTDGNLIGKTASVQLTGNPTWLLDGTALGNGSDGTLDPLANGATYTAPAQIPPGDPVTVSVSYAGGAVTLVTNLYILAHKYRLDVTLTNDAVCAGGSGYSYDYSTEGTIDLTLDASFDITSGNPSAATTPTISGVGVCNGVPCTAVGHPEKTSGLGLTTVAGGWQPLLRRLWIQPRGNASGAPDLEVSCTAESPYEVAAANNPWNAPGYIGYLKGKDGESASQLVVTAAFTAGPSFQLSVLQP